MENIMLRKMVRVGCMLAVLAVLISPALVAAAEQKTYTLAVIPNMPAVRIHKNWAPFVDQLSKDLGIKIELKVYDKINTFLDEGEAGVPDFIYSAPNMYYQTYQKQKYIPLVRSSRKFAGQVFVRKDSPYKTIQDLRGKNIAFVGPKNVCSILTRQSLLEGKGAIDFNATYSGSTVNVANIVLLGKADAGGTLDVSMLDDVPEMQKEFRTILETEKIASHPLSGHPRLPKKLLEAVTVAVLAMDKTAEGKKLLAAVKLQDPMRADFKRDYGHFIATNFDLLNKQVVK